MLNLIHYRSFSHASSPTKKPVESVDLICDLHVFCSSYLGVVYVCFAKEKKKVIPQIMKPWPSKHCFHHLDISLILHSSFYWGVYNSKGLIREEKGNLKIESGDIDLIQSLTKFYVVFAFTAINRFLVRKARLLSFSWFLQLRPL